MLGGETLSLPSKKVLTQELVFRMLQKATKKAEELGVKVNIAIVNDGGNLVGFIKMDGAKLIPGQIAQNKAYTAVGFEAPTNEWFDKIEKNPRLHGILYTERMQTLGGGLPIVYEGEVIGGIGVSGATAEQDTECAQAALEALSEL